MDLEQERRSDSLIPIDGGSIPSEEELPAGSSLAGGSAATATGLWNPIGWLNSLNGFIARSASGSISPEQDAKEVPEMSDPVLDSRAASLDAGSIEQDWLNEQLSQLVEQESNSDPQSIESVSVADKQENVESIESVSISNPVSTVLSTVASANNVAQAVSTKVIGAGSVAVDAVQAGVVAAIIGGIRLISAERDRDEVIRWFAGGRDILASDVPTSTKAKQLYQTINTVRFAKLLGNTIRTSLYSYKSANLPLALKVALPVTMIGAASFGMKGAGIVAFGSGIGLPVVLLLFLGTDRKSVV